MISKYAIRDYLKAKTRSHVWLKKVARAALMKVISPKINAVGFEFVTEPYLHQLVCFYLGMKFTRFLFLLDMGLGKTKIVLDLFAYYRLAGEVQRMLVVVPHEINVDGWMEEVEVHSDLVAQALEGTTVERWETLDRATADVYVIHYPGLLHMVCTVKDSSMKINRSRLLRLTTLVDVLTPDEVHKAKSVSSVTYRVLRAISKKMFAVYGLTGTPFGREPVDLFGQFYVVDLGQALGPTKGLFEEAFYRDDPSNETPWPKRVFRKRMRKILYKKLNTTSIRYRDTECGDVPTVVRNTISPRWDLTTLDWYWKLFETQEDTEPGNVYHTARGITAGYYRSKDEDGEESVIFFDTNPKLDALVELVETLPTGRKMIVFFQYVPSGKLITERLTSEKIAHAFVSGQTKDNVARVRQWKQDDETRLLVGNWNIIGTGGNLQRANYGVFFESPSSPIDRRQCEKRFSGARQKEYSHAFIYDLAMPKSYDTKILDSLAEGEDLFQAVIEGRFKHGQA